MNKDERYHGLIADLKSKDSWKTEDEFKSYFDFIVVELLRWGDPWMHSSLNNKFLVKYRDYKNNLSVEERIQRMKEDGSVDIKKIIRR